MTGVLPIIAPESTDLERCVMVHQRLLVAMVAYISRTGLHFPEELLESLLDCGNNKQAPLGQRKSEDFASDFIKALIELENVSPTELPGFVPPTDLNLSLHSKVGASEPPGHWQTRIEVRRRRQDLEVVVDGRVRGSYPSEAQAVAAVSLFQLSLLSRQRGKRDRGDTPLVLLWR